MAIRNIIRIDEDKCDGCGQCVIDCAESALKIVDGKARLVKEMYCDGLGACLGGCPTGALTIVQRESAPFDEEATHRHVEGMKKEEQDKTPAYPACPGSRAFDFTETKESGSEPSEARPELTNWPVQLKLVPVNAPFLDGADILLAADCTAFSAINFHGRFIKGKKLIIACPKLDDAQFYFEKLTEMFGENRIKSINVVRMEVPCCGGLGYIVQEALKKSGRDIPYSEVVISIKGEILSQGKKPHIPLQEA